jgi:hypothetical protein
MKNKYMIILPIIQILLVILSVVVDKSWNRGYGEGHNQEAANLISNIEFFIKNWIGIDDIVNYNFTMLTVLLGILFWVIVGFLVDRIRAIRR